MSRENVETVSLKPVSTGDLEWVRSRYQLWNEGGTEAMLREVWHPAITYYDPPDFPDASVRRGAAALAEHINARLKTLAGRATMVVQNAWWVREGQVALVELSLKTSGEASGVQLEVPLFHVLGLTYDGRTIELREYMQRDQALEAAGLRE